MACTSAQQEPFVRGTNGVFINRPKLVFTFRGSTKHRPPLLVRQCWTDNVAPNARLEVSVLVHVNTVKAKTTHSVGIVSTKQPNLRQVHQRNRQFSLIAIKNDRRGKGLEIVPNHRLRLASVRCDVAKQRESALTGSRCPDYVIDSRYCLACASVGD